MARKILERRLDDIVNGENSKNNIKSEKHAKNKERQARRRKSKNAKATLEEG